MKPPQFKDSEYKEPSRSHLPEAAVVIAGFFVFCQGVERLDLGQPYNGYGMLAVGGILMLFGLVVAWITD